jgi:hypothetical protein
MLENLVPNAARAPSRDREDRDRHDTGDEPRGVLWCTSVTPVDR